MLLWFCDQMSCHPHRHSLGSLPLGFPLCCGHGQERAGGAQRGSQEMGLVAPQRIAAQSPLVRPLTWHRPGCRVGTVYSES